MEDREFVSYEDCIIFLEAFFQEKQHCSKEIAFDVVMVCIGSRKNGLREANKRQS